MSDTLTPVAVRTMFSFLSSAAREVMMQMFVFGPVWDGNLVSKQGRSELVELGLVFRVQGWQSLTQTGIEVAIAADVSSWKDQRWHRKQACM